MSFFIKKKVFPRNCCNTLKSLNMEIKNRFLKRNAQIKREN